MSILVVTMLSALGATFMAINFHLANGGNHPWLVPNDGFNETIDVDAMLVMLQAANFAFSGYLLVKIRREHLAKAVPAEVQYQRHPDGGLSLTGTSSATEAAASAGLGAAGRWAW